MKKLLFLLLLLNAPFIYAQSIENRISKHQEAYHLEKIYISHNQPYYAPGDTLYSKVFLVNGRSHQFFEGTPIVYVDLISEAGEIQQSHILKLEEGKANLSFPISKELSANRYILRAYTQYQKNFDEAYIFQKEIKIIGEEVLNKEEKRGDLSNFSIQFFPEGGHLVNGLKSTVAFEARNGKGEIIDVQGELLNEKGAVVTKIKTFNDGIGIFNLTPDASTKYSVKANWNGLIRSFDFPSALKKGYILKANSRKKETINIQLSTNIPNGLKGCTLIGHLRGQVFLEQKLNDQNGQQLVLSKSQIPSGVLHFTLFDAKERPVSERLVYNNNPEEDIAIQIEVPKTQYGVKEMVAATISGTIKEKAVKGNMTVSVYNKELFASAANGLTIKNYLLLQSDLKGSINNINQYFEKNDAKSRTLLDYLMLTKGWRRFNWQDVLEEKVTPITFPTEESTSFAGRITRDNNKDKTVKADVFLNIMDMKNFTSVNLTTEEDGLFYFKGFDLPDETEIMLQANIHNPKKKGKLRKGESKRTGNKNVRIKLLNLAELPFNANATLKDIPYNQAEQKRFATEVNRIRKVDTIYHPEWTINLDEVTVRAQRLLKKEKRENDLKQTYKERGLFYSASSKKLYMEDLPAGGAIYKDVYEVIQAKIPGANVTRTDEGRQVLLRGQSSIQNPTYASIELNGALISPLAAEAIIPELIEVIDIKRGLYSTAVYGEAGNGGVISIITRDPQKTSRKVHVAGILQVDHPGYHKARTFYAPDYNDPSEDKDKPNYRTCLYWNPDAALDNQPTPVQFFTGDKLSEFLIIVEGISETGLPFVGHQSIQVGK